MGWVKPTSHDESLWTGEANAYDGNTATYASGVDTESLVLNLASPVSSSKVRAHINTNLADADIKVEAYYGGGYHSIQNGVVAKEAWVEIEIGSTQTVSKARITSNVGILGVLLCEFEFWEIAAAPSPDGSAGCRRTGIMLNKF